MSDVVELECASCPPRYAIFVLMSVAIFGVSVSDLAIDTHLLSEINRPRTSCEIMGGQCLPRSNAGVGECRTKERIEENKAFTWVQMNPKLSRNALVCPEHLHCCIEDPCESVLGGDCVGSCSGDGKQTFAGFCPAPKWRSSDTCCA